MLRREKAALCLTVFLLCCGCGRGGAEVTVPQVEVVEEPQVSQTEEQKRAELGLDTEAGTVLGEEEVVMMTEEGEPQTAMYTRVRGNGDFSLAYDTSEFSLTASENELRFEALSDGEADAASAFLSLRKEDAPSAEELADQYVANIPPSGSATRKGLPGTAGPAICMCSGTMKSCMWRSWIVLWRIMRIWAVQSI